jgi:hypothetical protein
MPDWLKKIKHNITPEIYIAGMIILVGFSSFGLGRLSALENMTLPISFSEHAQVSEQVAGSGYIPPSIGNAGQLLGSNGNQKMEPSTFKPGGQLVGSKNGSKYHFPWCAGAQRIKEENKRWFNSPDEARSAGYSPASNCKGLE